MFHFQTSKTHMDFSTNKRKYWKKSYRNIITHQNFFQNSSCLESPESHIGGRNGWIIPEEGQFFGTKIGKIFSFLMKEFLSKYP